ncbi:hypothetical protein DES34_114115 [Brevibacillus brevis]|nr:hypothetical protein DES34_114115 [Brevibacillus brevis]
MKRPIINIPKTGSEWLWDVVGFLFFVGSLLFLVFAWNKPLLTRCLPITMLWGK